MRKCPKCGQSYGDGDRFCEGCGCRLPENETRGKSPVPIIVGCVAAAVILIGATVACVTLLKGKKAEQGVQTVQQETEDAAKKSGEEEAAEAENESKDGAEGKDEAEAEMGAQGETEAETGAQPETADETGTQPETEMQEEVPKETGAQAETGAPEETPTEPEPQAEAETQPEAPADQLICYVVNCRESITLRKKPSTSAGEYCQIPLGAMVTFVEEAGNGFHKIIYNGQTGYALASYLSFEIENEPDAATLMEVVNCKESITLRKTPSTQAEEFCQIPLGELVEFLGTAENGFYMVSYNGYTGYALASYLIEW
ncbi:MAG: SH3 domain-containing protein [Clostridiales bacterium]|nr:SH3 domain-containing protein [Clostridiales bacterium]